MIEEQQLSKRSGTSSSSGRHLYTAAAILFPLLVFIGFGRTYYLRGFFDVPPLTSGLVHVHGILMTLWVVLFIAQVRLVASRRVKLHRQLGYAGVALAVLILITGTITALRAAKLGTGAGPPDIPPLQFLAVPLFDMLMFVLLFGGALYFRRQPARHRTLMLLTAINFLPPALGRLPVLQSLGVLWALGVPLLLVIAAVAVDRRVHGRFNGVFVAGAVVLILSYPVRIALVGTRAWLAFAEWATGLV